MITVLVYVADDGKVFRSKEECRAYEYRQNHLPESIQWFDGARRPIQPTTTDEIEEAFEKVRFWKQLDLPSRVDDLNHMYHTFGFGEPNMRPGTWLYIGDARYPSDEWSEWLETRVVLGWDEWLLLTDEDDVKEILRRGDIHE